MYAGSVALPTTNNCFKMSLGVSEAHPYKAYKRCFIRTDGHYQVHYLPASECSRSISMLSATKGTTLLGHSFYPPYVICIASFRSQAIAPSNIPYRALKSVEYSNSFLL